jgi:hypothetical protein
MSAHTRRGGPWHVSVFIAHGRTLAGDAYRTERDAIGAALEVVVAHPDRGLQIFISGPCGCDEWLPAGLYADG